MAKDKNTLYCSFCGKSQHEIKKLIAGPTCFICNECVDLCSEIIKEDDEEQRVQERLRKEGYLIIHESKLAPEVVKEFKQSTSINKFNDFFKPKKEG